MTYTITFRPRGPGPEPATRLKHLLKLASRACGLRCTALQEDGDTATKPQNARQLPLEVARGGETTPQRHGDTRSPSRTGFDSVRGQDASQSLPDGLPSIVATSRDIEDSEASEGSGPS